MYARITAKARYVEEEDKVSEVDQRGPVKRLGSTLL